MLNKGILFWISLAACLCAGIGPVHSMGIEALNHGDPASHVFLESEPVRFSLPEPLSPNTVTWRVLDDRRTVIQSGPVAEPTPEVDLGSLPLGWYRVEWLDAQAECLRWTTAAVLPRWTTPVPADSPICVDAAISWLGKDPATRARLAHLAALAGVNWIRDRLRWREMEPERGQFAEPSVYDTMAKLQRSLGMQVLQVFHDTPLWARKDKREGGFPPDLRDAYRFCEAMAKRFKGTVGAWEPWNEANAPNFGGHPGHEICSYQKAAYLGFKAGDPSILVGFNAYCAVPTPLYAHNVLRNETFPYFDTYNFHSYNWPHSYRDLWGPIHQVAGGKPLWLTETDRGLKYETPEPEYDFPWDGDLRKAEYIGQEYVLAMAEGVSRVFHFVLVSYIEPSGVQFGLLRHDLSPRPAYVALAALGRHLAGAQFLGRVDWPQQPQARVYAFRAVQDQKPVDVLVAWAEEDVDWPARGKTRLDWEFPEALAVQGIADYLGRPLASVPAQLTPAPLFVTLEEGSAGSLPLVVEKKDYPGTGDLSPIVMQCRLPRQFVKKVDVVPWSEELEYVVEQPDTIDLPIEIYNFSQTKAKGVLLPEHLPAAWQLRMPEDPIELEPMQKREIPASLIRPSTEANADEDCWIILRGEFGEAGKPVLAFRITRSPGENYPTE